MKQPLFMNAANIRQKLFDYICYADDKKLKAIYTMVEGEIREKADHWSDKDFLSEIDKRFADLESGKIQGRTWEEVKDTARQSIRKRGK